MEPHILCCQGLISRWRLALKFDVPTIPSMSQLIRKLRWDPCPALYPTLILSGKVPGFSRFS